MSADQMQCGAGAQLQAGIGCIQNMDAPAQAGITYWASHGVGPLQASPIKKKNSIFFAGRADQPIYGLRVLVSRTPNVCWVALLENKTGATTAGG
ncbi:hypothetical protein ACFX13_022305 [Malus domestica]